MKKRNFVLSLLVGSIVVFSPCVVWAKEVTLEDGQTIQEVIDATTTEVGDVVILPDGEYVGNVSLTKAVTLKGTSKEDTVIKGEVDVSADVTIQNLTISAKGSHYAGVKVISTSEVTISNVVIEYDGYDAAKGDYGNSDYFRGIWLVKDVSDESVLTVENSEIYAKYGIHLRSAKNTVTIKNSQITGYSAIDISNAPATTTDTLAESNSVFVQGSTLTGVTAAEGDSNHYGTIVIGGQKDLELVVDNSTVTNKIVAVNAQDLVRFGAGYLPSETVVIAFTNSKLINTDADNGSAVVNFMTEENSANANMIVLEDTTEVISANDKIIETYGDTVKVTFSTVEGDIVLTVSTGVSFDEEALTEDLGTVEGYTFDDWYADASYTTPFDFSVDLTEDTTIYAKFTQNETTASNTNTTQTVENVKTGDMNLVLVITTILVAGVGLVLTGKKIIKVVK